MQMPKIGKIGRYAACILLVLLIFLGYELRLVQWQIVDGEKYEQISLSNRTDTIELEAARGQILDREGNVLAGNRTSYNIVYNALYMDYSERNATIIKVIDLLEEREEEWRDVLPIVLDADGNYQFAEDRENAVASLKETLKLADYATADDCIEELAREYKCEGFSKTDTRNVTSVRYSMTRDGYSRTNPYVIAEDVSAETVGILSERSEELKGIETRVAVTRYYGEDGSLAPHVVGEVGTLQEEQYDAAVENGTAYDSKENISGYKWVDRKGQSGIEQAFESQLRGKRGEETIFTDEAGDVKSTAVTIQPEEGNTVKLTLDSDLQRVANLSLAKNIEGNTVAKNCTSGAAVVLDVKDFGVLASASYPTYDMNRYLTDVKYSEEILEDKEKRKPMYNRALDGTFVPGSVFKPMVALAALQEGVISAGTTYTCNQWFDYYDLHLKCTGIHGPVDLYGALAGSCNVYFCNVGLDLKIKRMDAYAEYFGLGTTTGVEIGEATGIMSNPQTYKEQHAGAEWTDGMSAQTAIGQADNMFTPIQLATYCATIANGGVRLQTHFLDEVTDYTGGQVVEKHQPKQLFDADLSDDVLGVVRESMVQVAATGTASSVFAGYPVPVACKTGTAETGDPDKGGTEPNLSFMLYAPAYDPEIAISVVMEYGKDGDYAKNVAKDILDQYFGYYTWDEDGNKLDPQGNQVDDKGEIVKTKEELDQEKAYRDLMNGTKDPDTSSSSSREEEPGASSASSESSRDNIPDTPFTGDASSAPEGSAPEGSVPKNSSPGKEESGGAPESSGSGREPDSPYE